MTRTSLIVRDSTRKDDDQEISRIENQIGTSAGDLIARIEALANEITTGQARRDSKEDAYRSQQLWWQRAYVIVTGCLSFLTIIVLAATLWKTSDLATSAKTQATVMASQAAVMRAQATITCKQLGISKNAVDAAVEANKLSELGLVAEVAAVRAIGPDADGKMVMTFANTGHTLANNVVVMAKVFQSGAKIAADFDPFTGIEAFERQRLDEEIAEYEAEERDYIGRLKGVGVPPPPA